MQTRNLYRSMDHVNWWEPDHWKIKGARSLSSMSVEGADPAEIRNGWLTLPDKARFQQKQLQEREMKITNLYEAQQARALDRVRHSPSNGNSVTSNGNGVRSNGSSRDSPPLVTHQPGKVRQMFEERRTKAGIDKSYPLQPIHNTERTRRALPNGYTKVAANSHSTSKVTEKRTTKTHTTTTSQQNIRNVRKVHHLPQSNGEPPSIDELDGHQNNYLLEDETFPDALAPVPTPRSPEPALRHEVKAPPRRSPEPVKQETKAPPIRSPEPVKQEPKAPPRRSPAERSSPSKAKPQPPAAAPPRRIVTEDAVAETGRARGAMPKASPAPPTIKREPIVSKSSRTTGPPKAHGSVKAPGSARAPGSVKAPSSSAAAGDPCSVCGRRFASDRLAKHEEICKKAHAKKRKPFDALKHRLAGTEAEPFINKLRKNNPASSKTSTTKNLNSGWRQKHNEFIQAIRAAKQVQAHLASGGKLSDLPPPPPSENPDYIACPHCGRRFNQAAAERHIPKCKSYQFNKPKAGKR